jgi:membrane protein DedA with SNARE-associated domain
MTSSPPPVNTKSKISITLLRILAFLVVVSITIVGYMLRDQVEKFAVFGYPGIFLIVLISYATILVPVPGLAIVFALSGVLNPVGVALAAALGGAIGELTGYMAGYSGRAVIENWKRYEKITSWVRKFGGPAILVLAALPNPFFDVVGIAAGVLKMPIHKFFIWALPGQVIKMLYIAYAGSLSLDWIFR